METANMEFRIETNAYGDIHYRNIEGLLHRIDGPALIHLSGYQSWWVNGKRHRTDGPAVEWKDGSKEWFINGIRHRLDGPAVIWANGIKRWYINGTEFTEKEFNEMMISQGFVLD